MKTQFIRPLKPSPNASGAPVIAAPKKSATLPHGVKPSIYNGQMLISFGLKELNAIIGGGVPLGTMCLLIEDNNTDYYENLLKYFISEGLSNFHSTMFFQPHFLLDNDAKNGIPPQIQQFLPQNYSFYEKFEKKPGEEEEKKKKLLNQEKNDESSSNKIEIPWRYQKLIQQKKEIEEQEKEQQKNQQMEGIKQTFGSKNPTSGKSNIEGTSTSGNVQTGSVLTFEYDLSKNIQTEILEKNTENFIIFDTSSLNSQNGDALDTMLSKISERISKTQLEKVDNPKKLDAKILRIVIQSLVFDSYVNNSPMDFETKLKKIVQFLLKLKFLMKNSFACCLITVPQQDNLILERIEPIFDLVMQMTTHFGTQMISEDYTGFLHFKKLAATSFGGVASDFGMNCGFRIRKRKMEVKEISLSPE